MIPTEVLAEEGGNTESLAEGGSYKHQPRLCPLQKSEV